MDRETLKYGKQRSDTIKFHLILFYFARYTNEALIKCSVHTGIFVLIFTAHLCSVHSPGTSEQIFPRVDLALVK